MQFNELKIGIFLSYVTIVLNNIIGLLYTPFMIRMLGQNEYGLFSLVSSVVAYLTVLDLGFGNAIVRYTAKYRTENKIIEQYELFGAFLVIYSIVGVLTFISGLICVYYSDNLFGKTITGESLNRLRVMLLLMVANIAISFPFSIWSSIIVAYERFVFQKVINIVRIILNPIVMIILLIWGYRAVAMVVVITSFNVASLLLNTWYCFCKLNIKIRFAKVKLDFMREVTLYSFWIFLNSVVDKIYWSSGQLILGVYKGSLSVAIYAIAIQLEHFFMNFSTAISEVLLPKVTSIVVTDKSGESLSEIFVKIGRIQYHILLFVLMGFCIFGQDFVILWAGENYKNAYHIALLFFIPLIIPLSQNVGITILQAKNQMKFRSILYIIIAFASVSFSIPLSIRYDGIGCAIGTTIALVIGQIIVMNIYYYRSTKLDIPRYWKEIGKISIIPFCFSLLFYLIIRQLGTSFYSYVIQIIAFIFIYIILLWNFCLNTYERLLLKKPIIVIVDNYLK